MGHGRNVLRVLLVGNYAPDRQESMLRFAELMERELRVDGHTAALLQPGVVLGKMKSGSSGMGKWLGYVDKFVLFPRRLQAVARNYDVVHLCDHSNAMYVKDVASRPHVVTCHDVLAIKSALGEVPQNAVSRTGKYFQRLICNGLKQARYTVCVSEATRRDLLRVTAGDPARSEVVYLSLNYPYSPMARDQALARLQHVGFDGRGQFFVHVGATVWYKNKATLLRIFEELTHRPEYAAARLVTVGGPLGDELDAWVLAHGLEGRVERLSGISNEDLRALYSVAEALIFPSLEEGFGWPVLEAQACGCPVFATNKAPMTELGGNAATYFHPADIGGAAAVIAKGLESRGAMAAAGIENVRRFNVRAMIDGYMAAYKRVVGETPPV